MQEHEKSHLLPKYEKRSHRNDFYVCRFWKRRPPVTVVIHTLDSVIEGGQMLISREIWVWKNKLKLISKGKGDM